MLRYLGLAPASMGSEAEAVIDAAFRKAHTNNPTLWAQNSEHIPTRQAKFEEFALYLALQLPPVSQPKARRAVLEAAITRLDIGLREAGVGDTSFSREMRTIAAALHGRLQVYEKYIILRDTKALTTAANKHGVVKGTLQAVVTEITAKTPLPKPAKPAKAQNIRQKMPKKL